VSYTGKFLAKQNKECSYNAHTSTLQRAEGSCHQQLLRLRCCTVIDNAYRATKKPDENSKWDAFSHAQFASLSNICLVVIIVIERVACYILVNVQAEFISYS